VRTSAGAALFGSVLSTASIADGGAVRQAVGPGAVDARLAHEGVLRSEVVDWRDVEALETAVAGPSAEGEPVRHAPRPRERSG
jgi:hypothetical protein